MFIWSMKLKKGRLIWCVVAVLSVIALILALRNPQEPTVEGVTVASVDEMVLYIESFGWEVNPIPTEEIEVIVPEEFDEIYQNYNELQLEQGFDLTAYQGELVKRTTFELLNYPDQPDYMCVDILTYGDLVVGADVCSLQLSGFMYGLDELSNLMTEATGISLSLTE